MAIIRSKIHYRRTIGEVLVASTAEFLSLTLGFGMEDQILVQASEVNGFPAIRIVALPGTDFEREVFYALYGYEWALKINVVDAYRQIGPDLSAVYNRAYNGSSLLTAEDGAAWLAQYYLPAAQEFLETYVEATVDLWEIVVQEICDTSAVMILWTFKLADTYSTHIVTQYTTINYVDNEEIMTAPESVSATTVAPIGLPYDGTDISELAEAVRELGFVDHQFSVNNGAAIMSIKGNIRIEGGEG